MFEKTIYERAKEVYAKELCARTLELDILLHVRDGFVYSSPTALALVRPVCQSGAYKDLTSPWVCFDDPDTWWVYLMVGNTREAVQHLPFFLPWIGWERKNVPRFYRLEKFVNLLKVYG